MQPAELIQSPVLASVSNCDDVSCGVEFTMWLCDGKVFSAGLLQYGQLGHNTDHEYNAKDCKHPLTCKLQRQMPVMLPVVCSDLHLVRASCVMHHAHIQGAWSSVVIRKASDVRSEEMSPVMHSLCVCMLLDAWLVSILQLFFQVTLD